MRRIKKEHIDALSLKYDVLDLLSALTAQESFTDRQLLDRVCTSATSCSGAQFPTVSIYGTASTKTVSMVQLTKS